MVLVQQNMVILQQNMVVLQRTHYFWVLGMDMSARPIPIPNDTQQVGYIPNTHTQVPSIFWVFMQKKQ